MIQFDDHIFQVGWFNHQLVKIKHTPTEAMELEREATLKANVERVEVCGLLGGFFGPEKPR